METGPRIFAPAAEDAGITDDWLAVGLHGSDPFGAAVAEGDAVIDAAVIAHDGAVADDDAEAMHEDQAGADAARDSRYQRRVEGAGRRCREKISGRSGICQAARGCG